MVAHFSFLAAAAFLPVLGFILLPVAVAVLMFKHWNGFGLHIVADLHPLPSLEPTFGFGGGFLSLPRHRFGFSPFPLRRTPAPACAAPRCGFGVSLGRGGVSLPPPSPPSPRPPSCPPRHLFCPPPRPRHHVVCEKQIGVDFHCLGLDHIVAQQQLCLVFKAVAGGRSCRPVPLHLVLVARPAGFPGTYSPPPKRTGKGRDHQAYRQQHTEKPCAFCRPGGFSLRIRNLLPLSHRSALRRSGAPHAPQKRLPGGISAPHWGHLFSASPRSCCRIWRRPHTGFCRRGKPPYPRSVPPRRFAPPPSGRRRRCTAQSPGKSLPAAFFCL